MLLLQGDSASGFNHSLRDTSLSLLLMPHPIFEIDELLRLIIDELMETSRRTVVSLALTCRSLEEPALSSLWKVQPRLVVLLKVLSNCTWVPNERGISFLVSCRDFLAQYPAYIPPDGRERSFNGGLGEATKIRFLDAWITPRSWTYSP